MNDSLDIQVVRGEPSAEELAAAIAVVQAALAAAEVDSAAASAGGASPKSTWNRNQAMLRQGIQAGANQWAASFKDGLR
ncbi:MAG: acyl-CoA carboxylase subunit epsilon [Microbacteriaceae bacterium]|nr:acyl-CoA carboxylase subunit epsilon [Microbacteriaceae bacterium]